jgi:HK97 gp10 family phage protein
MASLKMQGMTEYIEKLEKCGGKTSLGIIKHAVYVGARVIADEVDKSIDTIPTNRHAFIRGSGQIVGLSAWQKEGLHKGLGLAKMREEGGYVNTKLGFDGYNKEVTSYFPNGQPNAMIARSVESGTSRRPATHFVAKAVRNAKKRCEEAMAQDMDQYFSNIMEG